MRTLLRRRINEVTADNWTDGDLNDVLNLGLHKVQQRISMVDPEAIVHIARAPIVLNEEFVAKPQGFWYEKDVRLLDVSTGKYVSVQPLDYYLAKDVSTGDTVYSHVGRHFALHPIPDASVSAGLEILFVPTLDMAADTDVPDVNLGLHETVVKAAQLLLMPETGEPYKDLKEALEADLLEIPLHYRTTAGPAPLLNPQVPKNY